MSELQAAARHTSAIDPALTALPRELFTALYADLRRIAARELRRNTPSTLSPTTILHEAYLNLSPHTLGQFNDRAHFMRYAACTMRRLIIDHLRSRERLKRGGSYEHISLSPELPMTTDAGPALESLEDALQALAVIAPRLAECVDLKFFCGFSMDEIAELWQVSERTVRRDWEKACLLLRTLLARSGAFDVVPVPER